MLKIPGVDAAEKGHLFLVVALTYAVPTVPIEIDPPLPEIAAVGRLAAFEKAVTPGPTGELAVRDSFVALRATLTFLTVLRPANAS